MGFSFKPDIKADICLKSLCISPNMGETRQPMPSEDEALPTEEFNPSFI